MKPVHTARQYLLIALIGGGIFWGSIIGVIYTVSKMLPPSVHERAEQLAEKLRKIEGFHLTARLAVQKFRALNIEGCYAPGCLDKISVDLTDALPAYIDNHFVTVTTNQQTVSVRIFEARSGAGICFYQGDPSQIPQGSDRHHVTTNCFTFVGSHGS